VVFPTCLQLIRAKGDDKCPSLLLGYGKGDDRAAMMMTLSHKAVQVYLLPDASKAIQVLLHG